MAPKASQSCPPQLWNSHPGHRFKTNKVKGRQHKTLMAVSNPHEMTCNLWGLLLKGHLPLFIPMTSILHSGLGGHLKGDGKTSVLCDIFTSPGVYLPSFSSPQHGEFQISF